MRVVTHLRFKREGEGVVIDMAVDKIAPSWAGGNQRMKRLHLFSLQEVEDMKQGGMLEYTTFWTLGGPAEEFNISTVDTFTLRRGGNAFAIVDTKKYIVTALHAESFLKWVRDMKEGDVKYLNNRSLSGYRGLLCWDRPGDREELFLRAAGEAVDASETDSYFLPY